MYLGDLPQIAFVCIFDIVLQCLRAREFVIARWSGTDVSLTSNLSCESGHGTSDYFNVRKKSIDQSA